MKKAVTQYAIILLASLLVFPSTVRFAHLFSEHEHVYCDHYAESHFHQEILDCDLFKFQQTPLALFRIINYEAFSSEKHNSKPVFFYQFLSDYQKLPFELRGPPSPLFS